MKNLEKARLGSLVVERNIWVRSHLDTDHIRCLVNDLANGAKFPPLVVDKNTNIIVGGYHRYYAYKEFYGEKNYADEKVDVRWVDMPPIEDNLAAWKEAALEDNEHYVARLKYSDRNRVLKDAAEKIGNEYAIKLGVKYLHFTEGGATETLKLILDTWKSAQEAQGGAQKEARKEAQKEMQEKAPEETKQMMPEQTLPKMAKINYETGKDINPGRLRTPRTGLMALVNSLCDALSKTRIENLTEAEINGLQKLREAIDGCLREVA